MPDTETGKRYSHLYINRGDPNNDSPKARYRIGLLADSVFPSETPSQNLRGYNSKKRLTDLIQREIGVQFRTYKNGHGFESWTLFFNKLDITDFLDAITIIISPEYTGMMSDEKRFRFRDGTIRIFKEENLAFRIDDQGGVHPLIDSAFTRNINSAISGLSGSRYKATLQRVNEVDEHLLQDPPNYVAAIRSVFGACENLFKLMYGGPRLDAKSAANSISVAQQKLYEGHPAILASSAKLLNSFKEWIDSAHFYRHEEGRTEPGQPNSEIALLLISNGLSYVRWLATIDRKSLE